MQNLIRLVIRSVVSKDRSVKLVHKIKITVNGFHAMQLFSSCVQQDKRWKLFYFQHVSFMSYKISIVDLLFKRYLKLSDLSCPTKLLSTCLVQDSHS